MLIGYFSLNNNYNIQKEILESSKKFLLDEQYSDHAKDPGNIELIKEIIM